MCIHGYAGSTLKWSSFPARVASAHWSLHHLVRAFQVVATSGTAGVFPGVLDSFWTHLFIIMGVFLVNRYTTVIWNIDNRSTYHHRRRCDHSSPHR